MTTPAARDDVVADVFRTTIDRAARGVATLDERALMRTYAETLLTELGQHRDTLARVRSLHQPQPDGSGFPDGEQCRACSQDGGDGYQYLVPWPCPTYDAVTDIKEQH